MDNRSMVVSKISRWVAPLIFIFGMYVILYGHLSPGGGFPGGVILSSAFILVLLARGREAALHGLPFGLAKKLDAAGAIFFLVIAILGLAFSGVFFSNFIHQTMPGEPLHLFSAGIIIPANLAIGVKVAASLFLVMFALSALRISAQQSGEEKIQTPGGKRP